MFTIASALCGTDAIFKNGAARVLHVVSTFLCLSYLRELSFSFARITTAASLFNRLTCIANASVSGFGY